MTGCACPHLHLAQCVPPHPSASLLEWRRRRVASVQAGAPPVCRSGTCTQDRAPGRPTCREALCPLHETWAQLIGFPFG